MTKRVARYLVRRGIQRDGKYRFEPGDVVTKEDIPEAPVTAWLKSGVLEVVTNGDG